MVSPDRFAAGQVVAIPLRDETMKSPSGRFGLALVMGSDRSQMVLWLFGQDFDRQPSLEEAIEHVAPELALLPVDTGAKLSWGRWPVLGELPGWDESDWPVPMWGSRGAWQGKGTITRYRFEPGKKAVEERQAVPIEQAEALPPHRTSGVGAVEIHVTNLVKGTLIPTNTPAPPTTPDGTPSHARPSRVRPVSSDLITIAEIGEHSWSLNLDAPTPADATITERGCHPNGYFWASVAERIIAVDRPDLADTVSLDPEGNGLFAVAATEAPLQALAALLRPIATNPEMTGRFIDSAHAAGWVFDE